MNLLARLGLNISGFTAGLSAAITSVKSFAAKFPKLSKFASDQFSSMFGGSAIVSAVKEQIRLTVEYADRVSDLSDQLRISTDDIQRIMSVAGKAGMDFEDFAKAVENIGKAREHALTGDIKYQQLFARYGISLADLKDSLTDNFEILKKFSSGLSKTGINSQTEADALELLGKKGERLLDSLKKLKASGDTPLLGKKDIDALGEFWDKVNEGKRITKVRLGQIIGPIADFYNNGMEKAGANEQASRNASTGTFDYLQRRATRGALWMISNQLPFSLDSTIAPTGAITKQELLDRRKALGLRGADLDPVDGAKEKKSETKAPIRMEGDSLAKIGLFVGGAGGPMLDINRQQLKVAQDQLQEMRSLRADIRRGV